MEILCSFRLVLEEKAGKGIPGSSRLQLPDKLLANNFALADADNNNYKPLNRGGIVDLSLLKTLLAIPKSPKRATILKSDGIFCFCSIYKFGSFKNPSVMTTSLPELYFRSRRFILLVQKKKKKKNYLNYSSSTSCCEVWPDTYDEGYIHLFQSELTHKIHSQQKKHWVWFSRYYRYPTFLWCQLILKLILWFPPLDSSIETMYINCSLSLSWGRNRLFTLSLPGRGGWY